MSEKIIEKFCKHSKLPPATTPLEPGKDIEPAGILTLCKEIREGDTIIRWLWVKPHCDIAPDCRPEE